MPPHLKLSLLTSHCSLLTLLPSIHHPQHCNPNPPDPSPLRSQSAELEPTFRRPLSTLSTSANPPCSFTTSLTRVLSSGSAASVLSRLSSEMTCEVWDKCHGHAMACKSCSSSVNRGFFSRKVKKKHFFPRDVKRKVFPMRSEKMRLVSGSLECSVSAGHLIGGA